jgi:hypothetical protein
MESIREEVEWTMTLTEAELAEVVQKHSDECTTLAALEDEKRIAMQAFAEKMKPHKKERDRLNEAKTTGKEKRQVWTLVRDSLVTGQVERVLEATGEVLDTWVPGASVDIDEPDPKQPGLPFAAPAMPELRCTAIEDDGTVHSISAELADSLERDIGESAVKQAVMSDNGLGRVIVAVKRGKACNTCGIVAPHHRPECADMRAAEGREFMGRCEACGADVMEGDVHSYDTEDGCYFCENCQDKNDTAAVAAAIDAMTHVNDAPLVPPGEDAKPMRQVKPKRKAAAEGAVE